MCGVAVNQIVQPTSASEGQPIQALPVGTPTYTPGTQPMPTPDAQPMPAPPSYASGYAAAPTPVEPPKKRSKKPLIVLLLVALVLIIGGVAAAIMIPESMRNSAYNDAIRTFNEGNYATAQSAFESLGEYQESEYYVEQCTLYIRYENAMALYNAGRYEEAKTAFSALAKLGFLDADAMVTACENAILEGLYADAEELLDSGNREAAYHAFSDLGAYADSAARAESCLAPLPATGVLYFNPSYSAVSPLLVIEAGGAAWPTLVKIYSGDELVATLFINEGETASVSFSPGTYTIKEASGDLWFGEDEMFGRNGYYAIMVFDDDISAVVLENNYTYTITLKISEGANVGNQEVDPDDF